MSDLETWAIANFGAYVEPDFPPERFQELTAAPPEPQTMIRWLLKTAIFLELSMPRGEMVKIVPSLYPVAHGTIEPTDFHAWAAYTLEGGFNLHILRGFPVWKGGKLQPFQVHEESMNFGVQLNHFALRLFRCPSARPFVVGNFRLTDGRQCMPFWLTQDAPCQFPHTHVYPTFEAFMGAMEVSADKA